MKPPRDGLTPEFRGWLHEHDEELSNGSLLRFLAEIESNQAVETFEPCTDPGCHTCFDDPGRPDLVAMLATESPGATLTCTVCGDTTPANDWAFHVHSVPACQACNEPLTGTRCANQECHRCSVFPKRG